MSKEGAEQIKAKIKELSALIKEEAEEESAELVNEIKESVDELRQDFEKLGASTKDSERTFLSDVKDDINTVIDETYIKEFAKDVKNDVEVVVEHTHIKDFARDVKSDVDTIVDHTYIKGFLKDVKGDLNVLMNELDAKALNTKYTVQEKYSDAKLKGNKAVVASADGMIKSIDKLKCAIADCEKAEEAE